MATPRVSTSLVDRNTSWVQVWSLNSTKVTLPVTPWPRMLAVSRTGVPSGPPGEADPSRTGMRRAITMENVWHASAPVEVVAHTVMGPKVPAWVGVPATMPLAPKVKPGGRVPFLTENVAPTRLLVNWCG
ncbi:MAG: hypothetical protein ACR2KK_12005 [Acidimicrobiales bacterium]